VFGCLRFTELETIDAEAREPDADGWRFITTIKLRSEQEEVVMPRLNDLALDPVRHLLELRSKVRAKREAIGCREESTFWVKESGRKMSYTDIRNAAIASLREAGINETHPHHLKAAAVTELQQSGLPREEIVEYSRHKPGSSTWAKHYLDTGNSKNSIRSLLAAK
jgi:hypothetical protein